MATYYVATDGNDSYTTVQAQNPATPWLTLQKAADNVVAGDTVIVKEGTYTATSDMVMCTIDTSGAAGNPITFKSENPATTNINHAILDGNWVGDRGFVLETNYLVIDGFEIKNFRYAGIHGSNDGTNNITITRNHIHHIAAHASLCSDNSYGFDAIFCGGTNDDSYNWLIDRNIINDNGRLGGAGGVGVWDYYSGTGSDAKKDHPLYLIIHDSVISNNLFYNSDTGPFRGWPIICAWYSNQLNNKNMTIVNNTFIGPSESPYCLGHICFSGGDSQKRDNIIANNISWQPRTCLVHDWGAPGADADGSIIRNNLTTKLAVYTDGNSNVWAQSNNIVNYSALYQVFVDKDNYDFSLVDETPAINTAYAADLPTYDIIDASRPLPVGSSGDMGAYEFDEPSIDPPDPPSGNEITGLTLVPDGSWSDILDLSGQSWATASYTSNSDLRTKISLSADATRIRVTLKHPADTADTVAVGCWIGKKSSANDVDFGETPTQLLLSGNGTITLAYGGGYSVLDVCDLTNPIDHAQTYLFSFHNNTSSRYAYWHGAASVTLRRDGVNECGTVDVDEASYSGQTLRPILYKIEKYTWTYPNTYSVALTTEPGIVSEDGQYLTQQDSIANVEANAGSYYWASDVIYIRPFSGVPGDHTYLWQTVQGQIASFACDEGSGGTITDSINSLTGTLTNGSWKTWKGVDVIEFNGSDTDLMIAADSFINGLTEFSYTAWVWVHPLAVTLVPPRIFSKEADGSHDFYICIGVQGYIGAAIYDDTVQYISNGNILSSFPNRWSFIVVTYNDSGDRKLHIYVNGQEISYIRNEAVVGVLNTSANDLYIGSNYAGDRLMKGKMTKINIYNEALTSGEVATAYQNEWPYVDRIYMGLSHFLVH